MLRHRVSRILGGFALRESLFPLSFFDNSRLNFERSFSFHLAMILIVFSDTIARRRAIPFK